MVTRTVSLLVLRETDWSSDTFKKKSVLGDPDQLNVGIVVSMKIPRWNYSLPVPQNTVLFRNKFLKRGL